MLIEKLVFATAVIALVWHGLADPLSLRQRVGDDEAFALHVLGCCALIVVGVARFPQATFPDQVVAYLGCAIALAGGFQAIRRLAFSLFPPSR